MKKSLEDLNQIREILKRDPNNPQALKAVGKYYLKEGHFKQAKDSYCQVMRVCPRLLAEILIDYEQVIAGQPKVIGPRLSLAGFKINQGELEPAIMDLEEASEVSPKNVEVYNVLGRIYLKLEKIDETIAVLERSMQEGIKDVSLTEILAGAYLEKGRIPDAIRFYDEILNHRPGDKHILRRLAELYTRVEDYNQAAKKYREMFSDDPEVSREIIQRLEGLLKKVEGNVFIRKVLAEIYMRSLDPEAAVVKLREILRLDMTELDDVIAKLKDILKNYPGHPQAVLAFAEAMRRQGNFSEAVESYYSLAKSKPEFIDDAMRGYQEILELYPDQILARTYLAEAFLYKNQIKDALEQFEKMLKVDPSTAEAVIKKCREIMKSQPQLLLAHSVLGRAYLAKDDLQRAVMEAEGIIAIDKKNTPAYLLLGEAYLRMKMCRRAVEVLRSALAMDPYNLDIQEKYREAGEKEIDLEIEKIKNRTTGDPWKISLHLDIAKLYLRKGMREEAIRELQLATKDQARAPFALNLLGGVYRGEGRYDRAAAQFNRALELAPPELSDFIRTVRFNLGTTYEAHGLVRKALKIYEGILQEDIDFGDLINRVKYLKATSLQSMRSKSLIAVLAKPEAKEIIVFWGREGKASKTGRKKEMSLSFGQNYNTSGFEYFMKGMHKAALEEFQLAVQLDVKFAAALNNLGVSLIKEGKPAEARPKFQDAVNINPNSVVFRNNLGVVYYLLGQVDQAKAELEKAYTIDPELAGVCMNLGDICYFKNDIRRALDLYKRAGDFDVLTELAEQRLAYKTP